MSLSLNVTEYECNLSKFNDFLFVYLVAMATAIFHERGQPLSVAALSGQSALNAAWGAVGVVRVTSYLYIWFGNIHFIVDVIM